MDIFSSSYSFNSRPSSKKSTRSNIPLLPKIEPTESNIDMSMLDVMNEQDFLSLLKGKTDGNWKELWKETCLIVQQLKASRELLSIGSGLIGAKSNRKILDRLVSVTRTLLEAERIAILEYEPATSELVVTHAHDESIYNIRLPINSGIEGKAMFDFHELI